MSKSDKPKAIKIASMIIRPDQFRDVDTCWNVHCTGNNESESSPITKFTGNFTTVNDQHAPFKERKSLRLVLYEDPGIEDFIPEDAAEEE